MGFATTASTGTLACLKLSRRRAICVGQPKPADRIDLYHLGVRALNVQRGLVQKPEVFVLPSLD